MVRQKKKGKGKLIFRCACCAIIIGLIGAFNFGSFGFNFGNGGFGLFSGSGGSGSGDSNSTANEQYDGTVSTPIIITGELILYDEQEISLEYLSTLIIDPNYSDVLWELRSDRAIAAVYDDVRALFLENNISFTETMD